MPDINTVVVTPSVSVVAVNSSVPGSYDSVARLGLGWFNVVEYGAVGNGVTDDSAAIALANTAAAALAGTVTAGRPAQDVTLYFPAGKTFAVASGISLSYKVNVQMDGRVVYTGSSNEAAITYGSTSAAEIALARRLAFNVSRSTQSAWTSELVIGVKLINCDTCLIDIVDASNFTLGVQGIGVNAGFTYNTVTLGYIRNNKVGLDLTNLDTSSVGWCNENLFLGGRFGNDTGVNSTLQRWGIRITSDSAVKYYNNNNVFQKPSLELNNAGSGAATPILIAYGVANHFHDVRQESNDTPLVVVENDSRDNDVHFGYSSAALATITDDGTYPTTYVTQGQRLKLEQPSRLVWHSGPLHKLACYSDGATNVNVPTVHIGGTGSGDTLFSAQTNLTLNADYLDVGSGRGVGVFVDTRNCKEFVVRKDAVSGRGGRMFVVCYDSSGTHLTSGGGGHPYVKTEAFHTVSYSASYGGGYQTGSDSTDDFYFKVGTDVAWVRVLCSTGSSTLQLRSFAIFAVGQFSDCAAWTGVQEVVAGGNTGTAAPTSGTWEQGRIVWNRAPAASGFIGWVCVTAGTPGTWKTFGAISS